VKLRKKIELAITKREKRLAQERVAAAAAQAKVDKLNAAIAKRVRGIDRRGLFAFLCLPTRADAHTW